MATTATAEKGTEDVIRAKNKGDKDKDRSGNELITDDMIKKMLEIVEKKAPVVVEAQKQAEHGQPKQKDPNEGPNSSQLEGQEHTAPFELICNFLTALMMEDYSESLQLCKSILNYEPNNRVVQEFKIILEELVKNPEITMKRKGKAGDESESEETDLDHCLSAESQSSFSDSESWSSCSCSTTSSSEVSASDESCSDESEDEEEEKGGDSDGTNPSGKKSGSPDQTNKSEAGGDGLKSGGDKRRSSTKKKSKTEGLESAENP